MQFEEGSRGSSENTGRYVGDVWKHHRREVSAEARVRASTARLRVAHQSRALVPGWGGGAHRLTLCPSSSG